MNTRRHARFAAALPVLIVFLLGCGPSGDGQVVSCSCDVDAVEPADNTDPIEYIPEASIEISLCETSFTTDHTSDAQTECVTLADASEAGQMHQCACSCVHLVEPCDTK
jgi:hypothetical protein